MVIPPQRAAEATLPALNPSPGNRALACRNRCSVQDPGCKRFQPNARPEFELFVVKISGIDATLRQTLPKRFAQQDRTAE